MIRFLNCFLLSCGLRIVSRVVCPFATQCFVFTTEKAADFLSYPHCSSIFFWNTSHDVFFLLLFSNEWVHLCCPLSCPVQTAFIPSLLGVESSAGTQKCHQNWEIRAWIMYVNGKHLCFKMVHSTDVKQRKRVVGYLRDLYDTCNILWQNEKSQALLHI